MAEPLLTKDAINIGGHKFPIALVGALAAVLGVLVVIRARRSGSNVAGAGPQAAPGFGASPASFAPDPSAALANLSQQITGIQQDLAAQRQAQQNPPPSPAPSGLGMSGVLGILNPPTAVKAGPTFGTYAGDPGYFHGANPGMAGGPGYPGPAYSWAWRWTDAYAAATGLSNAPQFGANPGSPGGPAYPGPANSWEWTWLQRPGDLLSAPGGPDYIGPPG